MTALEKNPYGLSANQNKQLKEFRKAWNTKQQEAYAPLVEWLFMIMRGHNKAAMSLKEENRPRCPGGVFDDLLRLIGGLSGEKALEAIQPMTCG